MVVTCRVCGQAKTRSDFYPHPAAANGLLGLCKDCHKDRMRANRASKPDQFREYDRVRSKNPDRVEARKLYAQTERGKQRLAAGRAAWEARNPERRSAQVAVGNAIRDGRLVRMPCFICGGRAEAHHPAYSAPLDVSWLCRPHHDQLHAEHDMRVIKAA